MRAGGIALVIASSAALGGAIESGSFWGAVLGATVTTLWAVDLYMGVKKDD